MKPEEEAYQREHHLNQQCAEGDCVSYKFLTALDRLRSENKRLKAEVASVEVFKRENAVDSWRRCYAKLADSEAKLREAAGNVIQYIDKYAVNAMKALTALREALEEKA